MVIPGFQNEVTVIRDRLQDIRKCARIEAVTVGYRDLGFEPNLGITAAKGTVRSSSLLKNPLATDCD